MTYEESIKWLESLKKELGQIQYQGLWDWEEPLTETIELLQSHRLVELPCKVGDEAYYLTYKSYNPLSYKVAKAKVIKFYINRSGIFDIKFQALKSNFTFRLPICKVFFDKSEAEAKLKELNNER